MASTPALCNANNDPITLVFVMGHSKKLEGSESMSELQWKLMMNAKWNFIPLNYQIMDGCLS